MDSKLIWIIVVIAAAAAVYIFMREKINLRKAAGGEDKERLKKAVARALPGESGYQVAYGHLKKRHTMDAEPMLPTIPMPLPVTQAVSGSYPCPLIRSLSCRESQS